MARDTFEFATRYIKSMTNPVKAFIYTKDGARYQIWNAKGAMYEPIHGLLIINIAPTMQVVMDFENIVQINIEQ